MNKGNLYLIPTTLGDSPTSYCLPEQIKDLIELCDEFIVENERSARRFIKKIGANNNLDSLILHELNKHTDTSEIPSYLKNIENGTNIGIISESGCPAVADPGANVVAIAHDKNIKVIPLVGPSSIIMALMASGFSGQNFAFNGYLPKNAAEKIKKIRQLEKFAVQLNQTQLFIEAPFRNQKLLLDLLNTCLPGTKLCIATEITTATEQITTKTVLDWKKNIPNINKRNTVFVIGA
ncbi:MAG: SAM-dependent methyltransferase [Flavobacteriales bacterium]|jgi:16S rRNA (cytidine1402-2'-O)-methyltransferase|nr:SAM-dependent methyltransferase [Flavobacteriales bacterium]